MIKLFGWEKRMEEKIAKVREGNFGFIINLQCGFIISYRGAAEVHD